MSINNIKYLPKIGARNLKSALSISFCIITAELFNFETPFYAAITSVICMQDSFENSIDMGKNRFFGTVIGAITGSIATLILHRYNNLIMKLIVMFILSVSVIYICTLIKRPGAVPISCIVLLGTVLLNRDFSNYLYALDRSIETFVGVIISILVNRFIFPLKKKKFTSLKKSA